MFLLKCPDNFIYSQYRGKTVGLDSKWISPWAKTDRTSKAWVVVDPIPGKVVGDSIPKIIWEKFEEEMKRQLRETKAIQKESKKIEVRNSKEKKNPSSKSKSDSESKTKNNAFFNPFQSIVTAQ
jgi:hypothetical protein